MLLISNHINVISLSGACTTGVHPRGLREAATKQTNDCFGLKDQWRSFPGQWKSDCNYCIVNYFTFCPFIHNDFETILKMLNTLKKLDSFVRLHCEVLWLIWNGQLVVHNAVSVYFFQHLQWEGEEQFIKRGKSPGACLMSKTKFERTFSPRLAETAALRTPSLEPVLVQLT